MVTLYPKLDVWQDNKPIEHMIACQYCKLKPDCILLLTQTQNYICEECYRNIEMVTSNTRDSR